LAPVMMMFVIVLKWIENIYPPLSHTAFNGKVSLF